MASTPLTRTVSSTGNLYKGTLSMWFKRSVTDQEEYLFENYETSGNRFFVRLLSTGQLGMETLQGSSTVMQINTLNQFFDVGSWYHIVVGIDSTLATAADRVKVYINGVQQTSYTDETQPSQNQNMSINEGNPTYVTIGRKYGASNYFNGSMSQVIWIDGTQYAASTFGSTNSTSGEWTPNAGPTVTYGTNGFKLTFEDTSNLGDDTSGNTNDLATSGSPTSSLDCPSNNFSTFNPLDQPNISQLSVYTYGNTVAEGTDAGSISGVSTLGASAGKYYAEFKMDTGHQEAFIGVVSAPLNLLGTTRQADAASSPYENNIYCVTNSGAKYLGSTGTAGFAGTFTSADILGVGLDCDNNRLYVSKNGQWTDGSGAYNSATPSGYITLPSSQIWQMIAGDSYNSGYARWSANFGNGNFKGVAVTSAGTGASTPGTFEYDVPSGYQPLTTKGLNV